MWMLAQLDPNSEEGKQAIAEGWWNLSFILLVGTITVLFLVGMILMRRWKHKQLRIIEEDRAERRAGQSAGRVDAWQASAERYVDHDKLTEEDDTFQRDETTAPGEDDGPPGEMGQGEEEERDPFGLFEDKPYQDPEDEDDFDEEDDGDWDDEEDEGDPKR